jgi:hypothetical protein
LLAACGDDDDSTPVKTDASVSTMPGDASIQIDASVPSTRHDATVSADASADAGSTDAAVDLPLQQDASEQDAALPPNENELLSEKLRARFGAECGAFDDGKWSSDFFAVRDGYERCLATCFTAGPCDDFTKTVCGTGSAAASTSITACLKTCDEHPADGFSCSDGSKITIAQVCNAAPNCPDGADELNCPDSFTCKSGNETVPGRTVCDGAPTCRDGSDEQQGCARCK